MEVAKPTEEELLSQQIRYYRARAPHYDDWWYRRGRYVLEPERKAEWDAEVARLEETVDFLLPAGRILELACGTGIWTERLVRQGTEVVAVDSSPEAIAMNRRRTAGASVTYVEADLFEWAPADRFDAVFFSFWVSHVPPGRWAQFWDMVRAALCPGGRAVFIDNLWGDGTWQGGPKRTAVAQVRTDGGDDLEYQIVKIYYEPEELTVALERVGWHASIGTTGRSFLVGSALTEQP